MNERQSILEAVRQVAAGTPLRRYTYDTVYTPGRCAQLVRETVEGALGLGAGTWEVAVKAHDFRKRRGGVDRWAADYEQAARALGLTRPAGMMEPGDMLFWPYRARNGNNYGHTAVYLGNGLILENSDINPQRAVALGSRQPLGAGTQVFVTPIARHGQPTGHYVSVKRRGSEYRLFEVPLYKLKERGLA